MKASSNLTFTRYSLLDIFLVNSILSATVELISYDVYKWNNNSPYSRCRCLAHSFVWNITQEFDPLWHIMCKKCESRIEIIIRNLDSEKTFSFFLFISKAGYIQKITHMILEQNFISFFCISAISTYGTSDKNMLKLFFWMWNLFGTPLGLYRTPLGFHIQMISKK